MEYQFTHKVTFPCIWLISLSGIRVFLVVGVSLLLSDGEHSDPFKKSKSSLSRLHHLDITGYCGRSWEE
jgi:hypothetical protein